MKFLSRSLLGLQTAVELAPKMVSEDFSELGAAAVVPSVRFYAGAVEPDKFAGASGEVPGLHSAQWSPDSETTIKTAVTADTAALMDLLHR
jgi:hypothetical protein